MVYGHGPIGLSVTSWKSAWPLSKILPSTSGWEFAQRCKACLCLLLQFSLSVFHRTWRIICAHEGTQTSCSREKAILGAGRGLKVPGFERHCSKSRCFHSHRQELIVGLVLAYRLFFMVTSIKSLTALCS